MRLQHRPRRGLALIEVLLLVLALGLAVALGIALLVLALRVNGAAAEIFMRTTTRATLADRFRQDIAQARAVLFPPHRERESTISDEIIVRRSDTEQCTYRFDNGKLLRIERVREKVAQDDLPLGAGCRAVSFQRGEGTVTLRFHGKNAQDITAALGGDRR